HGLEKTKVGPIQEQLTAMMLVDRNPAELGNRPGDGDILSIKESAIEAVKSNLYDASKELLERAREVPGVLPYRVERSRYYRAQFMTLMRALRSDVSGRIEGFVPYEEFVERRFGSAYEFIDMVGKRYNRVERQLSAMYQELRTAEAALLQKAT